MFYPEALFDPTLRSAKKLADKLGLRIIHCPVYEHGNQANSILFFEEGELVIGEDYVINKGSKDEEHRKAKKVRTIWIPANTIVINTNCIRQEYSTFHIFHECYHFLEHYLFISLQDLESNDRRKMATKTVAVEVGKEIKDPVWFAENQANRGALALMMPITHTRHLIWEECSKVRNYRHSGELFEAVIISMNRVLDIPYFRIRQRIVQLGFVEAKGAMNYVDKRRVAPFAFDRRALEKPEHTFIISEKDVRKLQQTDPRFNALMESGEYIYADGHIVLDRPEFVRWDEWGHSMLSSIVSRSGS